MYDYESWMVSVVIWELMCAGKRASLYFLSLKRKGGSFDDRGKSFAEHLVLTESTGHNES